MSLLIVACTSNEVSSDTPVSDPVTTTTSPPAEVSSPSTTFAQISEFAIRSTAFADGDSIPERYTCDGADVSPELIVEGIPEGVRSLALVVDDPDAPLGTWDHWVEYDIAVTPGTYEIPEGAGTLGVPGSNSWAVTGYGGPCPPQGQEHRYYFKVYALGELLGLPSGADSEVLYQAIEGRVMAVAEIVGTYAR